MGSFVDAQGLRQSGTRVSAMISLETIGDYSDAAGSQKYPALLSLFYPSRAISLASSEIPNRAIVCGERSEASARPSGSRLKVLRRLRVCRAWDGPASGRSGSRVIQRS
ncbi:MAG TPA: hypothetical protein VIX37_15620 [Candidatus Sulfotelmatobacter sp.]